jgi:methylglutamate dehydrogenase subunit C
MLKKHGDFIGRVLGGREGMLAPERLQLVGVRPSDSAQRLRNGTQLVSPAAPEVSLGYVTSCTPSVATSGWVGLALVAGGRARIGTRLIGSAPLSGERTEIELVSPHMFDAENARVRA